MDGRMKFDIQLRAGDGIREHQLDLPSIVADHVSGKIEFALDRAADVSMASGPRSADWAAIGPGLYSIILGGRSYEVRVAEPTGGESAGDFAVTVGRLKYRIRVHDPRRRRRSSAASAGEGPQEIVAPMPSRIVKVLVEAGQQVEAGSGLVVIEAMKMQNEMRAPRAGRVEKIYVREGEGVETGAKLVRLGS